MSLHASFDGKVCQILCRTDCKNISTGLRAPDQVGKLCSSCERLDYPFGETLVDNDRNHILFHKFLGQTRKETDEQTDYSLNSGLCLCP
jgi:hypothetical protein